MTETTMPGAAAHAVHGEHEHDKAAIDSLGLWLFILSESILFASLIAARFYLAGLERPPGLNLGLGVGLTVVLLVSSFLGYRAQAAIARDDRRGLLRSLVGAIATGILFVAGVALEWSSAEFAIGEPYGSAFFSTTGLHVSHVLGGLVMLALVANLARRGHFSGERHWGVSAAVRYWTFVDVMWVALIFPTLYLL